MRSMSRRAVRTWPACYTLDCDEPVKSLLKQATDALSAARDELTSWEERLESKADELERRYADLKAQEARLAVDQDTAKRVVELHRLGDRRAQINTAVQIGIGFVLGILTPIASSWLARHFALSP